MELFKLNLRREDDIITARTRAREVARRLGFESRDQVRIATAVSELTRNTVASAGHGSIAFEVEGDTSPQLLVIRVTEHAGGGGEPRTAAMRAEAAAGAAVGVIGARRLMDHFDVIERPDGQVVTVKQVFPRGARLWHEVDLRLLVKTMEQDVRRKPLSVLDELKQQNRELAEALQQLEDRQKELSRLNAELFDTNRGVLALYSELDEKAEHLRNADQLKTRFLSNMSHEFRTPLNSILALTRLLNERVDGELSAEQEKQVGYIRKSALELLELVNDLLDLAKVEAGKTVVRAAEFSVEELFSALRGMLRPLLIQQNVALVFEDAAAMPVLFSDEGKVSQILRNFLSNALKFTEHGEIRVSSELRATEEGEHAVLCVQDTGIGIATQDHERIFEEFTQVEGPLQYRARGTGLGLPLCRKLAQLLGGRVWVQSELGVGSRFYLCHAAALRGRGLQGGDHHRTGGGRTASTGGVAGRGSSRGSGGDRSLPAQHALHAGEHRSRQSCPRAADRTQPGRGGARHRPARRGFLAFSARSQARGRSGGDRLDRGRARQGPGSRR